MQNNKYTLCSFLHVFVLRISWNSLNETNLLFCQPSKYITQAKYLTLHHVFRSQYTHLLCSAFTMFFGFIALKGKFQNNVSEKSEWMCVCVCERECGFHNLYLLNYMEDTLLFRWDSQCIQRSGTKIGPLTLERLKIIQISMIGLKVDFLVWVWRTNEF